MVLPVVLFPYALIHSFTGLLVPEVSGGIAAGEKKHIEYIASRVWRLTVIFGLCGVGVLAVCSKEFGEVLYSNSEAGRFIYILAPLMPLMYLDTVTDSLLKGMGEQVYTMNVNIADASLSVILVRLLVPRFGILGYVAVLYIAELINFAFSAARLLKQFCAQSAEPWVELPQDEVDKMRKRSPLLLVEPPEDCELLVTRVPLKMENLLDKNRTVYRVVYDPEEKLTKLYGEVKSLAVFRSASVLENTAKKSSGD